MTMLWVLSADPPLQNPEGDTPQPIELQGKPQWGTVQGSLDGAERETMQH